MNEVCAKCRVRPVTEDRSVCHKCFPVEVDSMASVLVGKAAEDAMLMVENGRGTDGEYTTIVRAGEQLWTITVKKGMP